VLFARVRRTIAERGLLERGERVLVACSGGPDSVVLLHVLHHLRRELGVSLEVASVDHGLRPEAAAEVEVVGDIAGGLGLPFHPLRADLAPEGSVQETARTARYALLTELARERGASRIAFGHTLDDQAETVLARVLRGAGVRGLGGIDPRRPDGVVRPLIDCRRAEVEAHLRRFALPALRDPSNRDPRFERVRIREEILPRMAAEDPRVALHLAALADEARGLEALVDALAEPTLANVRGSDGLDAAPLRALPEPLRRAVFRGWVEDRTGRVPGRAHLVELDRLVARSGEVLLPGGWTARRVEGDTVVLTRDRLEGA